jgi:hypothetical protein
MAGLTTPLASGFSVVTTLADGNGGLTKGTLFWSLRVATNDCDIYSSADGTTWTNRTQEALTAMGWFPIGEHFINIGSPVAIGDVFTCWVRRQNTITSVLTYYILTYNGTQWSAYDVTAYSGGFIAFAATWPLSKANGRFFYAGSKNGILTSTNGTSWTVFFAYPTQELGGPTYGSLTGIIYDSNSAEYRGAYMVSAASGTTTQFIKGPIGSVVVSGSPIAAQVYNIFMAGGEFYAEAFRSIYKSTNFATWVLVRSTQTDVTHYRYFPVGDGFLSFQWTTSELIGNFSWLPYSKNTLINLTTAADESVFFPTTTVAHYVPAEPIIVSGYFFFFATDGVKTFKYDAAWDDNTGVADITGALLAYSVADVASIAGGFTNATGVIQGTLRLDTSDGAFAARRVYLYNYATGAKVAETTSDGTTGTWQFAQVAPGEYFVVGAAQGDDLNIPRDFDALGVITIV